MNTKFRSLIAMLTIFVFLFFVVSPKYNMAQDTESQGVKLIINGEKLYEEMEYDKAAEKFREALKLVKLKKNLIRAYLNLSRTYYAMGVKAKTEEALENVFKLEPKKKIEEEEYPRGYLEIYHQISAKYSLKLKISPREKKVKGFDVIESPGKKKKKKKSNVIFIVAGLVVLGVVLYLLLKKKDPKTDPSSGSGSLKVESTPTGAEIWLDGSRRSEKTNATLQNISAGSHIIKLTLEGYWHYEETVQVAANATAEVSHNLEPSGIEWIRIPAGEFKMGDNYNEGSSSERPVHTVYLDGYYMSKYEVTFDQYDRFCEETNRTKPHDDGWGRGSRPVINVSWYDAKAFCNWLSEKSGYTVDLPTEAQWEKAARGTDQRRYPWGDSSPSCGMLNYNYCWSKTTPVGSYSFGLSPYGLWDMAGNVWEWCLDWYDSNYYSSSPYANPTGPSSGVKKVFRGGDWSESAKNTRSMARNSLTPDQGKTNSLGFRISRK